MPTAQETFVSNMSALATAINAKTGVSLPLSITGMTAAVNSLAFEPARDVTLNFMSGTTVLSSQTITPGTGYTQLMGVNIQKPAALISANVRYGKTIAGIAGTYTYVSQNAAGAADILEGKIAFVNGSDGITGTYKVGTLTVSAATLDFSASTSYSIALPSEYNAVNAITIAQPASLLAGNIRDGITIAGISGTYTHVSQNAATKDTILSGYKAFVNGSDVITGSIATKAAATYYTSTANQTIASKYYLGGTQTIVAVTTSNITDVNIAYGVNVTVGDSNNAGRIKNVTGTFTASDETSVVINDSSAATWTSNDILNTKTAYIQGKKITGAYKVGSFTPPNSSITFTNNQYTITSTDYSAMTSVVLNAAALNGWSAAKIAKGQTIAGVTGTYTSDANATAAQIFEGKTAYVNGNKLTGTFTTSNLTATAGDILIGKTAYVNGSTVTGTYKAGEYTVPDNTIIFSSGQYAITSFNTSNAATKVTIKTSSISGWDAGKIAQGKTIGGVTGTYSYVASNNNPATAATILSGYKAFVNGGTMMTGTYSVGTFTASNLTFSGGNCVIDSTVTGSNAMSSITIPSSAISGLTAANIKSGASIAGVNGTYTSVSDNAADASKILFGYKAFVNGGSVMTGTYKTGSFTPPNGSITFNASNQYTITSTDYSAMTSVILNAAALSGWDAAKIAYGKSIGGISGSYSYVASNAADASKILKDYKAFVNGGTVLTGTYKTGIYTVPANTITLSNGGTIDISSSSLNAMTKVTINTDSIVGLSADKIKYNQSVAGITGTYTGDGTATAAYIISGKVAYSKGTRYVGTAPSEEDIYTTINGQTFG